VLDDVDACLNSLPDNFVKLNKNHYMTITKGDAFMRVYNAKSESKQDIQLAGITMKDAR
jgi:hypothetical protein